MLTTVESTAAELVRNARAEAGLSMRDLAARAAVSYTTVCRIERGQVDPTVSTLRKLLLAMGEDLRFTRTPIDIPTLAELSDAWEPSPAGDERIDWTRLRAFVDHLERHREHASAAIELQPPASGSALLDNILAGVAEKTADDVGFPRPAWTRAVAPLERIWEGYGTPRMRAEARKSTPHQLLERHVVLPAATLWRERVG